MLCVERYKEINTTGCEKCCTGIKKEIYKTGELAALFHRPEITALNETYAVISSGSMRCKEKLL